MNKVDMKIMMKTKKIKLSAIFCITALLTTSCDNSGSALSEPYLTTHSGRVLSDATNITVCLDTKKTYLCKDEELYKTNANNEGRYTLKDVPNSELNQYNIVAEVILVDQNGIKVLAAPGMLVHQDSELIISPLLSLITKYSEAKIIPFTAIYEDVLTSMAIDSSIDLSKIDYKKYKSKDETFNALSVFNYNLYNTDIYQNYFFSNDVDLGANEVTQKGTFYSSMLNTQDQLGKPFSESITLRALAQHVENDFLKNAAFTSLLPTNIPANTSIRERRYEELQDVADGSNMVRSIALEIVGIIPKVGMVIGPLMDVFWDAAEPDFSKLIYDDVKALIRQEIENYHRVNLSAQINSVRDSINDFKRTQLKSDFQEAYQRTRTLFRDTANNEVMGHKMIPQLVLLANLRMMLNRELYTDVRLSSDPITQDQALALWVIDYKQMRDTLLNGERSMYEKFMKYRTDFIKLTAWQHMGGLFWMFQYNNTKVEDEFTEFSIHYEARNRNHPDVHRFVPSSNNIKVRLIESTRLKVAKQLSSTMLMSRLFPSNVLGDFDLAESEKLGIDAYYVPESLKTIQIGAISYGCSLFFWADIDHAHTCLTGGNLINVNNKVVALDDINLLNKTNQIQQRIISLSLARSVTNNVHNFLITSGFKFLGAEGGVSPTIGNNEHTQKGDNIIPGEDYSLVGFENIAHIGGSSTKQLNNDTILQNIHYNLVALTPVFAQYHKSKATSIQKYSAPVGVYPNIKPLSHQASMGSLDYRVTGMAIGDAGTITLQFAFFPDESPIQ